MRKLKIFKSNIFAGTLTENENNSSYEFAYEKNYSSDCISLTMPDKNKTYSFEKFPSFFENLLSEGLALEGLFKIKGIDKSDYISQLIIAGKNLFGDIGVEPYE